MRPEYAENVTVTIAKQTAVIRRSGNSRPTIALILGTEYDNNNALSVIYLDRIVHKPGECSFNGWNVSGAVVTELRPHSPSPAEETPPAKKP